MSDDKHSARSPKWFWIPVRVLIATFLIALLAFAVSLLLGIIGVTIGARVNGTGPDMRIAYRYIAAPASILAAAVVLVSLTMLELRHYRRSKALAQIERIS